MHEDMIKHLEFVQAVITRLASNSFLLKGWATTLAASGFALVAADTASWYILAAVLFATVTLWMLDAFYLRQERLFRNLYDAVRVASYHEWEAMGRFSLPRAAQRGCAACSAQRSQTAPSSPALANGWPGSSAKRPAQQ